MNTHAHHTVSQHHCHGYVSVRSGVESLIASVRHYVYVCVWGGVSQTVSDIISTFDIILFPEIAEL